MLRINSTMTMSKRDVTVAIKVSKTVQQIIQKLSLLERNHATPQGRSWLKQSGATKTERPVMFRSSGRPI